MKICQKQVEPLVSIVMPTFNRANLIHESIDSILNQTYKNWELLIVDDGSIDNTAQVIKDYNNKKISYFELKHTGKLGEIRNYGISKAKGDFIAFQDSDDIWESVKLKKQIDAMNGDKSSYSISGGEEFGIDPSLLPNQESSSGSFFEDILFDGKYCVVMPSLVFRTSCLDKVKLLNKAWISACDVDFLLRLAYHFKGSFLSDKLVKIRKHSGSSSTNIGHILYDETFSMYNSFVRDSMITKKQLNELKAKLYFSLGILYFENCKYANAINCLMRKCLLAPTSVKGWLYLTKYSLVFLRHKFFNLH